MSLLAPSAALAALGRFEQILDVVPAAACGAIFFHLGWWQKTQPFKLNLIESALIVTASFALTAATFGIVLRFPGPYMSVLLISALALIGFAAYGIRQFAAVRISRTA